MPSSNAQPPCPHCLLTETGSAPMRTAQAQRWHQRVKAAAIALESDSGICTVQAAACPKSCA
eukprot:6203727-Pleurochrysis_carterae.AAC.1